MQVLSIIELNLGQGHNWSIVGGTLTVTKEGQKSLCQIFMNVLSLALLVDIYIFTFPNL